MFPTVSLILPESLNPNQAPTSDRPETQYTKRKYFEKKPTEKKSFERKSLDRRSIAFAKKSTDDVSNAFSSLSTVFNFVDFAASLNGVSSENGVFVNLIQRVRRDVTEASRLRTCHAVIDYFDAFPGKKVWIDAILLDVKRALNDIGVYVENVRVTGDDGGVVGLKHKFEWVLSHHQKLLTREISLSMCHQSLMAAVQTMQAAEMGSGMSSGMGSYEMEGTIPSIYEAPVLPWLQDEGRDVLRSPYSRQKWRLSQRNLSLPSITVSDFESDDAETNSINSIPVELPGSVPEDLPHPDNWDLYAPPPKPRTPLEKATPQTSNDILQLQTSLDQVRPRLSQESVQLRRSFERARPRAFSDRARPRASTDQIKPRASTDQIRPRPSLEQYKSRASLDQISPLPVLTERPVRNDSSASISKAATIPLLAKRYRPKAVHVRNRPKKHRSLPSQLPDLPNQPSLISELSHWVLPSAVRESYQSTDTYTSLDNDTPSTSITSSPVIPSSPASCPEVFRAVPSVKSVFASSAPTTPSLPSHILPPAIASSFSSSLSISTSNPNTQTSPPTPSPKTSPTDTSSSSTISTTPTQTDSETPNRSPRPATIPRTISRKPVPKARSAESQTRAVPSRDLSKPGELETSSSVTEPGTSSPDSETRVSVDPTVAPVLPVGEVETAQRGDEPGLSGSSFESDSVGFPGSEHGGSVSVVGAPVVSAPAMSVPAMSAPATSAPAINAPSMNPPAMDPPAINAAKPMTSQSKRRAAHARRMRIAYGSE